MVLPEGSSLLESSKRKKRDICRNIKDLKKVYQISFYRVIIGNFYFLFGSVYATLSMEKKSCCKFDRHKRTGEAYSFVHQR